MIISVQINLVLIIYIPRLLLQFSINHLKIIALFSSEIKIFIEYLINIYFLRISSIKAVSLGITLYNYYFYLYERQNIAFFPFPYLIEYII